MDGLPHPRCHQRHIGVCQEPAGSSRGQRRQPAVHQFADSKGCHTRGRHPDVHHRRQPAQDRVALEGATHQRPLRRLRRLLLRQPRRQRQWRREPHHRRRGRRRLTRHQGTLRSWCRQRLHDTVLRLYPQPHLADRRTLPLPHDGTCRQGRQGQHPGSPHAGRLHHRQHDERFLQRHHRVEGVHLRRYRHQAAGRRADHRRRRGLALGRLAARRHHLRPADHRLQPERQQEHRQQLLLRRHLVGDLRGIIYPREQGRQLRHLQHHQLHVPSVPGRHAAQRARHPLVHQDQQQVHASRHLDRWRQEVLHRPENRT